MRLISGKVHRAIALSVMVAAAALPGAATSSPAAFAKPAAIAKSGRITVATTVSIPTLDGIISNSVESTGQIYDQLTEIFPDGTVRPRLARKWTHSSDGSRWSFTLRRGVRFHNGAPLTPADVVYSFRKVLATPTSLLRGQLAAAMDPDGISASGNTINFNLRVANVEWARVLSQYNVVPREAYEANRESFFARPIGSGPWRVTGLDPGVQLRVTRFERYWGRKPQFATAIENVISDETTRLNALRSNAIDVSVLSPTTAPAARRDRDLKVVSIPGNAVTYIAFNTQVGLLGNANLRHAVSLAIDRKAIAKSILQGAAVPAGQLLAPATFGHSKAIKPLPYNRAQARRLVQRSGYSGQTLPFNFCDCPQVPGASLIAQAVQGYLAAVGISVTLKGQDAATFTSDWNGRKFPGIWMFSFQPSTLDGALVYNRLLYGTNYFTDPALDAQFKKQAQSTNDKARLAAFGQIARIIKAKNYFVPLFVNSRIWAWRKAKVNIRLDPRGLIYPQYFTHPK